MSAFTSNFYFYDRLTSRKQVSFVADKLRRYSVHCFFFFIILAFENTRKNSDIFIETFTTLDQILNQTFEIVFREDANTFWKDSQAKFYLKRKQITYAWL